MVHFPGYPAYSLMDRLIAQGLSITASIDTVTPWPKVLSKNTLGQNARIKGNSKSCRRFLDISLSLQWQYWRHEHTSLPGVSIEAYISFGTRTQCHCHCQCFADPLPLQTKPTPSLLRKYGKKMLLCNYYVTHVMVRPMSGARVLHREKSWV